LPGRLRRRQIERHHGTKTWRRSPAGRRRSRHDRGDGARLPDPHYVEPKPSFILKLQADVLVVVGRELEIGWLPPLIQQSRNSKIQAGAGGYLDASANAEILEIPTGQVTRDGRRASARQPHYWLDPENGKRIGKEVSDKFSQLRERSGVLRAAPRRLQRRLDVAKWLAAMAPYRAEGGHPPVVSELAIRLDIIGYVEPRPGFRRHHSAGPAQRMT
jgi:zinc/manganese transport system substrate-binding protein